MRAPPQGVLKSCQLKDSAHINSAADLVIVYRVLYCTLITTKMMSDKTGLHSCLLMSLYFLSMDLSILIGYYTTQNNNFSQGNFDRCCRIINIHTIHLLACGNEIYLTAFIYPWNKVAFCLGISNPIISYWKQNIAIYNRNISATFVFLSIRGLSQNALKINNEYPVTQCHVESNSCHSTKVPQKETRKLVKVRTLYESQTCLMLIIY